MNEDLKFIKKNVAKIENRETRESILEVVDCINEFIHISGTTSTLTDGEIFSLSMLVDTIIFKQEHRGE